MKTEEKIINIMKRKNTNKISVVECAKELDVNYFILLSSLKYLNSIARDYEKDSKGNIRSFFRLEKINRSSFH